MAPEAEQIEMWPPSEQDQRIERCIREMKAAERKRLEAGQLEKQKRERLQMLLTEAGFKPGKGGYKRGKYVAWLDSEGVKAKARLTEPEPEATDEN